MFFGGSLFTLQVEKHRRKEHLSYKKISFYFRPTRCLFEMIRMITKFQTLRMIRSLVIPNKVFNRKSNYFSGSSSFSEEHEEIRSDGFILRCHSKRGRYSSRSWSLALHLIRKRPRSGTQTWRIINYFKFQKLDRRRLWKFGFWDQLGFLKLYFITGILTVLFSQSNIFQWIFFRHRVIYFISKIFKKM